MLLLKKRNLFLAALGLCCCAGSLVAESRGLLSGGGAWGSHCGGFSCEAQAVEHANFSSFGSQALEHGLNSCGAWA